MHETLISSLLLLLPVLVVQVTSEELNVEKKIKDVCAQMRVKVHTCWGSTLYHRDDLPFRHPSEWEQADFFSISQKKALYLWLLRYFVKPDEAATNEVLKAEIKNNKML